MMKITDKTVWVVSGNLQSIRTLDGLRLLDFDRGMSCDLALLAGAVWLLIKWTPVGITVKEIVDLLETAAPLPRNMLETETCGVVADLARSGFVRKRPSGESVSERRNAQEPAVLEAGAGSGKADKGTVWLISPNVLATYTDDGALVVNVPKEICYSLNHIASRIWLAMESSPSGITLEGIVGVLEETLEIPRERLASDVSKFLDNLQQMSLVRCGGHFISRKIGACGVLGACRS